MQSVNMDQQQQAGKGPAPADRDIVLTPMSFYQFPVPEFSENMQEQESGDDVINLLISPDSHQPCESSPGMATSFYMQAFICKVS